MTKTVNKHRKSVNQKSIKNLKPFPKGKSGNPSGRAPIPPDEKLARQIIKDMNSDLIIELIQTGQYKKLLKQAIEASCRAGRMEGLKFLNDYNGNNPREVFTNEGEPITEIVVRFDK